MSPLSNPLSGVTEAGVSVLLRIGSRNAGGSSHAMHGRAEGGPSKSSSGLMNTFVTPWPLLPQLTKLSRLRRFEIVPSSDLYCPAGPSSTRSGSVESTTNLVWSRWSKPHPRRVSGWPKRAWRASRKNAPHDSSPVLPGIPLLKNKCDFSETHFLWWVRMSRHQEGWLTGSNSEEHTQ